MCSSVSTHVHPLYAQDIYVHMNFWEHFCYLFLLKIILALGNYMNSSKRGAVYGFKLQSLDLVRHTHIHRYTQSEVPH